MLTYFKLQFNMCSRVFKDSGITPIVAFVVLFALFTGGSVYLFRFTSYAQYVYFMGALTLTGQLSDSRRNDFLKICFPEHKYYQIRITENLLLAFPFTLILLYQGCFWAALALPIVSVLLVFVNFKTSANITIPTPFYAKPFEFAVGFRNTFYIIAVSYALGIIAIAVNNFNLGVFSLLIVFTIALSYYSNPEDEFYVWVYSLTPRAFLFEKIKTAIVYSSLQVLPITISLILFFSGNIGILLLVLVVGWAFLICMIVSKYAAYPDQLNIAQGIIMAICIGFPPLLVVLIPYLFFKSENRLNGLLK